MLILSSILLPVSFLVLLILCQSSNCLAWSPQVLTRRQALAIGALPPAFLPGRSHDDWAYAASATNPAEAIRRGAASIPGYGPTDVFYPKPFLGNWKATREILPTGNAGSGASLTLEYPVRFISSIEDDAVVADRGYNQANLEKSIKQLSAKSSDHGDSSLPSYTWVETNPNDLRIFFADGSRKDIKVTKRATEKTDETVFSSEFQRVSQDDTRGIPSKFR